jgi:uncharacterized protein
MTAILWDTAALIAFFIGSEKHHRSIVQYVQTHPEQEWIILSTVFDETVTWFRAKVSISASIEIGQLLREEHRYIPLSAEDDLATWEAFIRYNDKAWSYTDCSLLVMAQRLNIVQIASFDEHIRQMQGLGIVCVPKPVG